MSFEVVNPIIVLATGTILEQIKQDQLMFLSSIAYKGKNAEVRTLEYMMRKCKRYI